MFFFDPVVGRYDSFVSWPEGQRPLAGILQMPVKRLFFSIGLSQNAQFQRFYNQWKSIGNIRGNFGRKRERRKREGRGKQEKEGKRKARKRG